MTVDGGDRTTEERERLLAEARIEAFRTIVRRGHLGEVDGMPFDLFTAAHIVALDDRLHPAVRDWYRGLGPHRMADLAFKAAKQMDQARSRKR